MAADDIRIAWNTVTGTLSAVHPFGIAARVAAGAFYTREDEPRLAAQAIGRGDFIGCNPEVPGD